MYDEITNPLTFAYDATDTAFFLFDDEGNVKGKFGIEELPQEVQDALNVIVNNYK